MKVLIIGDLHFKVSNIKDTDLMCTAILDQICNQRAFDFIVVLGDTLDRHETIHVTPLCRSVSFLSKLMEIAPVYLLIGNHDLKNNRQFLSPEHPFSALKFWGPRMTVVDTVISRTINEKLFIFVPYTPPGRFEEALATLDSDQWKQATCIFAHQEFKGAQMGAVESNEGDVWPLDYPLIISGHIHEYQRLQPNIWYLGTPIQQSFGDQDRKTISSVHFDSQGAHEERLDLGVPRKRIVHLTADAVNDYIPEPNCEIKFVIEGLDGEIKAIMKHPNIEIWKRAGYKISYKNKPINRTLEISQPTGVSFLHVLYHTINKNERSTELCKLYTRIFGTHISTPGSVQ
jgi:DNA repair exonuclease SbcCD nuclease subunit